MLSKRLPLLRIQTRGHTEKVTASISRKQRQEPVSEPLPQVPTTHIEISRLRTDALYSGYRPLASPLPQQPRVRKQTVASRASDTFAGKRGTGGIATGGVHGAWKHNPHVTTNLWTTSASGMEWFKEMENVPRHVLGSLVPFMPPKAPGSELRYDLRGKVSGHRTENPQVKEFLQWLNQE